MEKIIIGIDESGDDGHKFGKGSTNNFVLSAICINEKDLKNINKYLDNIFEKSHIKELKYSVASKSLISNIIKEIKKYDIKIFYINIDKRSTEKNKDIYTESLYFICKQSTEVYKDKNIIYHIDYRGGKKHSKNIGIDLQKFLNKNTTNKCKVKYMDSKNSITIQMSDLVSGILRNKFENNKDEEIYNIIKKLII